MKKQCKPLEEPMNAQERYMHGINERLDIVIDLLERIVPKQEISVQKVEEVKQEEVKVVAQNKARKSTRKPKVQA